MTENNADFEDCVREEEQSSGGDPMASIQEGIGEVRDELRNQIRNNAVDHMIRGPFMIVAGIVLFRIHGPRTELFAHGLMPGQRTSTTGDDPAAPLPPPPGATPLSGPPPT